jgi:hypothetical protein
MREISSCSDLSPHAYNGINIEPSPYVCYTGGRVWWLAAATASPLHALGETQAHDDIRTYVAGRPADERVYIMGHTNQCPDYVASEATARPLQGLLLSIAGASEDDELEMEPSRRTRLCRCRACWPSPPRVRRARGHHLERLRLSFIHQSFRFTSSHVPFNNISKFYPS